MKISILHPSRGRARKSLDTCVKWYARAGVSVEIIISVDNDDPDIHHYYGYSDNHRNNNPFIIRNDNRSAVDAINKAAQVATGDIFIVVSDDTDCPENWAVNLLKEVEGKEDWILKCQDGIQPWIITMPVMDRKYYNRFGYIYYPEYLHMFCDTELSCVADLTGRRLTSKLIFPHLHYSTGAYKEDLISKRADKTWEQGKALFLSRFVNRFGISDSPAAITDENTVRWANSELNKRR